MHDIVFYKKVVEVIAYLSINEILYNNSKNNLPLNHDVIYYNEVLILAYLRKSIFSIIIVNDLDLLLGQKINTKRKCSSL